MKIVAWYQAWRRCEKLRAWWAWGYSCDDCGYLDHLSQPDRQLIALFSNQFTKWQRLVGAALWPVRQHAWSGISVSDLHHTNIVGLPLRKKNSNSRDYVDHCQISHARTITINAGHCWFSNSYCIFPAYLSSERFQKLCDWDYHNLSLATSICDICMCVC